MADNPCILGIDPGADSGAIAFYFAAHPEIISAEDMPCADHSVDAVTLAARIEQMRPDMCVIEAVSAMQGWGVSSTFKFGVSYGIIRGVVLACRVPLHFVTPGRWKKYHGLTSDKDESRAKALSLWPSSTDFSRKKDHGRAEAALLARYGAETIWRRGEASWTGAAQDNGLTSKRA